MNLQRKIVQYHMLKRQYTALGQRLEELSKDIKKEVGEGSYDAGDGLIATVKLRRSKPKVDDTALAWLLDSKGLKECFKEVVDHGAVEQAWKDGKLTDNDLRSIMAESKFTLALTIEEQDVQGSNEGLGTGRGDRALHDRPHSEATEEVSRDT